MIARGLSASLLAGLVLIMGAALRAQDPPGHDLVAVESLEQGFILIVQDKTGLADAESPIYLASNHTGWNPGRADLRLMPRSDMRWQIVLPRPTDPAPMEFKFTRGDWEHVEINADLSDKLNRRLPRIDPGMLRGGEPPRIELVIDAWADMRPDVQDRKGMSPYRTLNVSGDVRRVQVTGGGGDAAGMMRDVLVWLPPGYDDPENAGQRYPVLYLQDGQNIFEELPGVPGEWHADETAAALIESGEIQPLIIVAIPHSGSRRASEYMPFDAGSGVEPGGEAYVRFLASEVIPRIERSFRIAPGAESTGIGGASLGALISLYAAAERPDLFGRVLLESMPLLPRRSDFDGFVSSIEFWPQWIYIGAGGREASPPLEDGAGGSTEKDRQVVALAEAIDSAAALYGVPDEQRLLIVDGAAGHDERAWAQRLPQALRFLFPARDD